MSRLVPAALAFVLAAGAISGCSPQPEPEDPPQFASEEEAFAAAEETYRAYVDALNQVDLSDPETFEDVYAWTTAEANANERKTLSKMHADGWIVTGETAVEDFVGKSASLDPIEVVGTVCSNVSDIEVTDSAGASVVPDTRPDVYTLEVVFAESNTTPTGLAITSSNAVEDAGCTP